MDAFDDDDFFPPLFINIFLGGFGPAIQYRFQLRSGRRIQGDVEWMIAALFRF